jgi:hypothetical protein
MGNRPKQALSWYYNGQDWWREVLAFYVTLTDRPGDMDEWLIERAIASSTTVVDLGERVHYLRKALSTAFPAYIFVGSGVIEAGHHYFEHPGWGIELALRVEGNSRPDLSSVFG